MFYSQFILAKKGALGTIWIAAHLERKLRKNQVADTDIGVSVDSILFPEVPIALRLSSHLLLGVVRIYSKKVNYLFDDCSEALLNVKQAFRSTAVDLPPERSKAPYHSITLPETFDLDDFELPDNETFQGNFVDHHVSTREQITLQDTMDGVSFPTSQFGPDERFGDGDASQIGLDLDEELFMDKGDGAGTSGILVGTDADPLASTKESSHSKSDELDDEVSHPPLASDTNYFNIQAPSTPGLIGEPNLPSAKEEVQVGDEHMDDHVDEGQNASDLAPKEVSRNASSPVDHSDLSGAGFREIDNYHYMDKDNEQFRTFETGSMDFFSSGVAQPSTLKENLEANIDLNDVGIIPENEGIAADLESKGCFDADKSEASMAENAIVMHHCDPNNSFQPCTNEQNVETSVSNIGKTSSGFAIPVLQACTSKLSSACDDVDNPFGFSTFPVQEDGSLFGTARGEGAVNASGTSSNVGDGLELEPTSKEDQITHEVTCAIDGNLEGSLDNLITEENHFVKENNLELSNFPPPELLLSMPHVPANPFHNFGVDSTPSKEVFTKDDENVVSGKKRSFTESTLSFQSFYPVESSSGAQSKGTVEFVPDDNDLLSSILVGKSTGLNLKPTPPVQNMVRAKRQRTVVRSVVHKRKLLIDDSTVMHGDTIRQQLTNTEDIRRVRKKAPCTHLEVWVLQKQFLEDEIFSESVFTGMLPALQSLNIEKFDLNDIRILRDDRNKEASEADIATIPTLGEDTKVFGFLGPSTTDVSAGPKLNEETEDVATLTSSVPEAERLQISGQCLLETLCDQEPALIVDDNTLLKETQIADNHVMKEFDDMRISVGDEAMQSVVSEVNYNSTDHAKVDLTSLNISSDVDVPMHTDMSGQLLDYRSPTQCTIRDNLTMEDVSESGKRDQELDVSVSEKYGLDERSASEHILEIREGFDRQDNCSLPVQNSRVCPTDQVECQIDGVAISNKDETLDSSLRHDGSCLASNNVGDHVNLDSSFSVEMDLRSEKATLIEIEGPLYWEDDPKNVMDSTPILAEFVDIGNVEFKTDVIKHDTDFLNIDDDDGVDDYESDMPGSEEKRIFDNSGWSSRTRAVANYLQVLFENEYDPEKTVVSLDNLLVGKTRKEASRMFFETLVLKTKDYIQTEQETSYCDIKLQSRGKLLKSEFRSHM